jgi:hypothetical protein
MHNLRTSRVLLAIPLICTGIAAAQSQSQYQQRTLSVNGHSGQAMVYQIDGRSYVDLETLARIANGTISFREDRIVLSLPGANTAFDQSTSQGSPGMTNDFMKASLQVLSTLKDWTSALAYGIQRGVPGDGSRLVIFHDKAADQLRIANVDATSESDQEALRLLTNHFNLVNNWSNKLIAERKSMDTAKYSITPNALANDETYQKITSCSKFLASMLPSGQFHEDRACN